MPTPEKVFRVRGITAKGKTLPPSEIKLLSYKTDELVLNPRRMELIVKKSGT